MNHFSTTDSIFRFSLSHSQQPILVWWVNGEKVNSSLQQTTTQQRCGRTWKGLKQPLIFWPILLTCKRIWTLNPLTSKWACLHSTSKCRSLGDEQNGVAAANSDYSFSPVFCLTGKRQKGFSSPWQLPGSHILTSCSVKISSSCIGTLNISIPRMSQHSPVQKTPSLSSSWPPTSDAPEGREKELLTHLGSEGVRKKLRSFFLQNQLIGEALLVQIVSFHHLILWWVNGEIVISSWFQQEDTQIP